MSASFNIKNYYEIIFSYVVCEFKPSRLKSSKSFFFLTASLETTSFQKLNLLLAFICDSSGVDSIGKTGHNTWHCPVWTNSDSGILYMVYFLL